MVRKNLCIIQGRVGSRRLPGKIILKLDKKNSIIQFLVKRISNSKKVSKVIFSTSKKKENKIIKSHLKGLKCDVFFGDDKNVLKRFYDTAKKYKPNNIIRITADCPFIDPEVIDKMCYKHERGNYDYSFNSLTFPDGMDVEIFKYSLLKQAYRYAKTEYEKEHVTPYIKNLKKIKILNYKYKSNVSNYRITLDYYEDYILIKKIYKILNKKRNFSIKYILQVLKKNKKLKKINKKYLNYDGSKIPEGIKLWGRAKKIIPGGNMLFSKRPELFLPDLWPTYFKKAKGCYIWDLSNKKYIDLSLMGVGTNILGYSNPKIDKDVISKIKLGNMSTLNCEEEVKLVEKLIKLHPWFGMGRLARTGGEANSIAIRIARAYSKKQNIAFCGYHGWHDWYLAANLSKRNNLSSHLMNDLPVNGVNKNLKNTIYPFYYNDIKHLKNLVKNKNIGIIKMEVQRDIEPNIDFLKQVRNIAKENKIVLIFDECTSGFRLNFGGLHKKYKIYPDMCMFGKALGNGYAITAVLGKKDIMQAAQDTFISSTFWTERSGPAAALSTLKEMERIKSWEIIQNKGKTIKDEWKDIARSTNFDIKISGLDAIPKFSILDKNANAYKTFITQEMLKKNILASNMIFASTAHSDQILENYFRELKNIFREMKILKFDNNIKSKLNRGEAWNTFKRYN